ncbi:MAG TPA: hypothetical protein VH062_27290 [Polyangiaceae bacterium]|jgi:hypothetical protein|nr:hypothetical protein [Polyangiaceae bacterium]
MNTVARFQPRTSSLTTLVLYASLQAAACGGSEPAPSAPQASASPPVEAAPAETASATPLTAPSADAPAEAAAEPDEKPAAAQAAPPGGKSITYRMTPMGLVADVDGVQLEPRAEPLKLGGGWGVKLTVKAKAIDDREHKLQSPSQGPLMVAEEIDRGGKKELVPDARDGDGEMTLEKTSTPLVRELKKPIVSGQSLTLYVGLWGLGTGVDDRKPIKKLFVVKMVAGSHKPQPVVSAPE